MDILNQAKNIQGEISKNRRYFHENAEVGNELPKTTAYVMERLKEMGYEPKEIAQSAVVAVAGKGTGKTFMIRADMDALPMGEETDEPFKSKTPHMHSCGHDMHTAMLLGAAKLLKENEDKINGQVKLMFQPAEEILWGAKAMIDNGLMENPHVDAAMMIHVRIDDTYKTGSIILPKPGVASSSSDGFRVNIKGKGGHGASPQKSLDPITTAAHIVLGLQEILAKEIGASDEVVINICHVEAGSATNIIPDSALIEGTIRTFDEELRQFILKRVKEVITGIAAVYRTEAEYITLMSCPSVVNDKELFNDVIRFNKEMLGEEGVINLSEHKSPEKCKGAGSEDFGFVSQLVPAVQAYLVAGNEKDGYKFGNHNPKVRFDEEALAYGSAVYVNTALKWLEENNK